MISDLDCIMNNMNIQSMYPPWTWNFKLPMQSWRVLISGVHLQLFEVSYIALSLYHALFLNSLSLKSMTLWCDALQVHQREHCAHQTSFHCWFCDSWVQVILWCYLWHLQQMQRQSWWKGKFINGYTYKCSFPEFTWQSSTWTDSCALI